MSKERPDSLAELFANRGGTSAPPPATQNRWDASLPSPGAAFVPRATTFVPGHATQKPVGRIMELVGRTIRPTRSVR